MREDELHERWITDGDGFSWYWREFHNTAMFHVYGDWDLGWMKRIYVYKDYMARVTLPRNWEPVPVTS